MLPGEGILSGGTVQIVASDAVQHEVVPGAVVDTQLTGPDFQHLLDEGGAIGLGGAAAQVRYEGLLVLAEYAVDLLVEGVDIEAGHTGGQEGTHHRHQGCDQQQQDQHQLHMQASEQGRSPLYVG